ATSSVRQKIKSLVLIDAAVYRQRLPFHVAVLRVPFLSELILKYTTPSWRVKLVLNAAFWNRKLISRYRIERHAKSLDFPGSHWALIQTARQMLSIDLEAFARQIGNIDLRTLIVWGEKDRIVPVRQA